MTKRQREIKKIVNDADLELVDLKLSGGGHYRLVIKAPNGVTNILIFAATPSCSRGDLNKRGELRRFHRQNTASSGDSAACMRSQQ